MLAAVTDTRSMAGEMSLSEHTIQDHLTSIFAKTGSHDYDTVLSRAPGTRLENCNRNKEASWRALARKTYDQNEAAYRGYA